MDEYDKSNDEDIDCSSELKTDNEITPDPTPNETDSEIEPDPTLYTQIVEDTDSDSENETDTDVDSDTENEVEVECSSRSNNLFGEESYCYVISVDDNIYGFNTSLIKTKQIMEKIALNYCKDYNNLYMVRMVQPTENSIHIVGHMCNTIITYDQVFNVIKYERVKMVF